jgi:hypothetical protein
LTVASRIVTRRALLGAGAAALAAGCGKPDEPAIRPDDVLREQLRLTQLAVAAYAGVDAPGLAAGARARARRLQALVGDVPAAEGPSGVTAAYEAERRALAGYVAAIGLLRRQRGLLGELVVDAARNEAALARMLGRDPLASAFPGQPA